MIRLPAEYTPGNWGILADSFNPQEVGALAYFDGRSVRDNPYPIPGRRAEGWAVGYLETMQQVEGNDVC